MRRRSFLALPAFTLASGDDVARRDALPFGLPPWHMWGNTVTLSTAVTAASLVGDVSRQLFKVNYQRPETWTFFLGARIVNASPILSTGATIQVWFDMITGVGRTMFDTRQPDALGFGLVAGRSFAKLVWNVPAGPGTNLTELPGKWTTVGQTPLTDDRDAASSRLVEWFPAQDIQSFARLALTTIDQAIRVDVAVTAFVAPRTHVRPEWFGPGGPAEKFRGNEHGGT